jgi:hypothetical protein
MIVTIEILRSRIVKSEYDYPNTAPSAT